MIVDGLGSSEAGGQLSHVSAGAGATTGTFPISPGNHVLSATTSTASCEPGDDELGWLAKSGRLALGYLGDAAKTARTYPVIDGVRYAVPGDRARLRADGVVELHGRDSVTINSGGEKIFAEEVEAAIKAHPAVYDCVVAGRPSERWGNEVVAVVRMRDGTSVDEAAASPRPSVTSPATSCPRPSCSSTRSCAPQRQGRLPLGQADLAGPTA